MKETLGIFAFSCLSLLTASAFAAAPAWLDVAVSAESANTVEMRRHLHANPELGNQEKQTQAYIVQKLKNSVWTKFWWDTKTRPPLLSASLIPRKETPSVCERI